MVSILTIVNGCMNLIKLYLCKSIKSEKTIKHLKDYFRNYSKPRCTISNRWITFISDSFEKYLANKTIEQTLIASRTPCANGQIEHFNHVITSWSYVNIRINGIEFWTFSS